MARELGAADFHRVKPIDGCVEGVVNRLNEVLRFISGNCTLAQIQRTDFTARGGGEHTLASLAVLTELLA